MKTILGLILLAWLLAGVGHADTPLAAPYKRMVIREVRAQWGLDAPVALMAAQVHQESRWRPRICSKYACGLTQFTPQTASWIKQRYPKELGDGDVFNPQWAIRAMAIYNKYLYNRVPASATDCDRWAFTLSSYNGGLGWVRRDAEVCSRMTGCDVRRWWGNVAKWSTRSKAAFKENRGYPYTILNNQAMFETWGRTVKCSLPSGPTS